MTHCLVKTQRSTYSMWYSVHQMELPLLGYVVSGQRIRANPDKIGVIDNMSPPEDVKGIQGFMGMVNYYRQLIILFPKWEWDFEIVWFRVHYLYINSGWWYLCYVPSTFATVNLYTCQRVLCLLTWRHQQRVASHCFGKL